MKRVTVLTVLLIGLLISNQSTAQLNVNVNVGSQPVWGPVGYDYVDYYYMPEMDVYYSVPKKQYVYPEGNNWVFASKLPARYNSYNVYNTYKAVVNEPTPYLRNNVYKVKYAKFKGQKQVVIRDSHDNRYKNNGPGVSSHKDNGNGKNKGNGNSNGKSKGNGKGKGKG